MDHAKFHRKFRITLRGFHCPRSRVARETRRTPTGTKVRGANKEPQQNKKRENRQIENIVWGGGGRGVGGGGTGLDFCLSAFSIKNKENENRRISKTKKSKSPSVLGWFCTGSSKVARETRRTPIGTKVRGAI